MLWLQTYQCDNPECVHEFEEYVNKQTEPIEKEIVLCPKCQSTATPIIGNPKHTKHSSASTWRMGHGS